MSAEQQADNNRLRDSMFDIFDMFGDGSSKSVILIVEAMSGRVDISGATDIQAWAKTFCPNILASASASAANNAPSTKPPQEQPTAAAGTASPSTTAPTSPTSSTVDLHDWGANFHGTNWQSVTVTSKGNRGPAVEGVSIVLFIIAFFIVAFRYGRVANAVAAAHNK